MMHLKLLAFFLTMSIATAGFSQKPGGGVARTVILPIQTTMSSRLSPTAKTHVSPTATALRGPSYALIGITPGVQPGPLARLAPVFPIQVSTFLSRSRHLAAVRSHTQSSGLVSERRQTTLTSK